MIASKTPQVSFKREVASTSVGKYELIKQARKTSILERLKWTAVSSFSKQKDLLRAFFLRFLDMDIERNPHRLQPVTVGLVERIDALIGDDDIDLDAPLLPEDDD